MASVLPRQRTKVPQQPDGWLGPLFYWEMIRETRKTRSYIPRVLYCCVLLYLLYLVVGDRDITQKQASYISEQTLVYYLILQYLAVCLLTPIYVCGAIIEERQLRTLSLLLTTFVTPREIIVGKMMGRLMPILGVLLSGVPILAILQLLGGISIVSLFIHSLLALILLLSVGQYSIRCSTLHKTTGAAVFSTYMMILGLSGFCFLLAMPITMGIFSIGSLTNFWLYFIVATVLLHLFFSRLSLSGAIEFLSRREKDQDVAMAGGAQHEMQQRMIVLEAELSPQAKTLLELRQHHSFRWRNPPVFERFPILWKQCYFPDVNLLKAGAFVLAIFTALMLIFYTLAPGEIVKREYDALHWIIQTTMLVTLLLVCYNAAGSLAIERSQQTLISILAAPLTIHRIVAEYWFSSIYRYRWLLSCIGLLFLPLLWIHPQSLIILVLLYTQQLAFFSMMGILCSLTFSSSHAARSVLGVFFFFSYFILPRVFQLDALSWQSIFLLMPVRLWEIVMQSVNRRDFLWEEVLSTTGTMMAMTALLFLIACHMLHRWQEK